VIAAIKQASDELGRVPTLDELVKTAEINRYDVRAAFGSYKAALIAAGLEHVGQGYGLDLRSLFTDWAWVVRRLGKVPSVMEHKMHGKHSVKPLTRQFGSWRNVPGGFLHYAQQQDMESEWNDVMEVVANHLEEEAANARISMSRSEALFTAKIRLDEPLYGAPMTDAHLMMEPTNEQGVLFLFGAVARKMGFAVIRVQTGFPDCEAYREIEPGRWQRVWIELEYESRNFLTHMHDPAKCHLIVCWSHNWEECPLEVVELKGAMKTLADSPIARLGPA